jgi:hypothetical protein
MVRMGISCHLARLELAGLHQPRTAARPIFREWAWRRLLNSSHPIVSDSGLNSIPVGREEREERSRFMLFTARFDGFELWRRHTNERTPIPQLGRFQSDGW